MNNQDQQDRLENLPVSFFSIVMGLSGLTIAWEKFQHVFHIDLGINTLLIGFTTTVFVILLLMYSLKIIKYPYSVKSELKHPIKLSFFPSISISFLLLSIVFLSVSSEISRSLWIIGAILHLGFTLFVISSWMHNEHFQVNHIC